MHRIKGRFQLGRVQWQQVLHTYKKEKNKLYLIASFTGIVISCSPEKPNLPERVINEVLAWKAKLEWVSHTAGQDIQPGILKVAEV